jgi:tRNA threonylcarbamoyladenosine biosynthesis protein TsaB
MPSLRQLLNAHPNLLLIDSTSTRVQAGLWTPGAATRWHSSDSEAGTGVFACVEALLAQTHRGIAEVAAFVFCEGPGSVLGIRTAAVALRTWQVINPSAATYTYQSLDLVARSLGRPELSVIADARRDTWHVARLDHPLRRVPSAELSGELVMPEFFRHWTPLPAELGTTRYDVAASLENLPDADLFRAVSEPDAFTHEEPAYVTWTPQIHQAPQPRTA